MNLPKILLEQLSTGQNTIIITDHAGEPQTVCMSYQTYLELIHNSEKKGALESKRAQQSSSPVVPLTSSKLLDKINQEIAQWKEFQNPINVEDSYFTPDLTKEKKSSVIPDTEEERVYLENIDE